MLDVFIFQKSKGRPLETTLLQMIMIKSKSWTCLLLSNFRKFKYNFKVFNFTKERPLPGAAKKFDALISVLLYCDTVFLLKNVRSTVATGPLPGATESSMCLFSLRPHCSQFWCFNF